MRSSLGDLVSCRACAAGRSVFLRLASDCCAAILLLALPSLAQAPAAQAKPASTAAAQPPGRSVAPVARQQAEKPGGTEKPKAGSESEGIRVHGHWVIEVKNPDGKLVSHTEFENGLSPLGGATLLAGLLTGTVTPGSWYVYLASDSSGDGAIVVAQPSSNAASSCQATVQTEYSYQVCYDTLSVSGSQLGSGGLSGSTVTLTGSASLPTSASAETIASAETVQFVCSPSNSPSACFDIGNGNSGAPSVPFTARSLDGVGSDPPSVQVSPGQAILVSVVISFSSGS